MTEEKGLTPTFSWFREKDEIIMICYYDIDDYYNNTRSDTHSAAGMSYLPLLHLSLSLKLSRREKLSREMFLFLIDISLWSIWRNPSRNPPLLGCYNSQFRGRLYMDWSVTNVKHCVRVSVCAWVKHFLHMCAHYLVPFARLCFCFP